jgi:hypothetical protein
VRVRSGDRNEQRSCFDLMSEDLDERDIILFPFPYDDFTGSKRRPAIIVGNAPTAIGSYIVAKITSVLRHDSHSFMLENQHLSVPLRMSSEVRCNNLATVAGSLFIKKVTTLDTNQLELLCDKIKLNFEVANA